MSQLKPNLYRYRSLLSGFLLLTVIYFVTFTWLTLPAFTLVVGWHPDTQLTVLQVVEEQYQAYVQPGDVIVSVNGQIAQRGERLFSYPVQSIYDVLLLREGQTVAEQIPVGESLFFRIWLISQSGLALVMWLVGFLTTQFARREQMAAVYTGLSFQLIAAGIVSPGPTNYGAPGAWVVGQVLVFYFPVILIYLSLVPRQTPLPPMAQSLLKASFAVATTFALLAAIEAIWLFPEQSIADYLSIRSSMLLTIVTGIGMVLSIAILLTRLFKLPRNSYMRQQVQVVTLFLTLAITPLFLLVILPLDQTLIFAPFPVIYSFFLLAPAGYFFVFHRQGYLALDMFFSRVVMIAILILAVVVAYTTGVYLLEVLWDIPLNQVRQGGFMLLLLGVVAIGQRPVQQSVDLLIYGQDILNEETIQEINAQLAADPGPATVTAIVQQIGEAIQVQEMAVLAKETEGYKAITKQMAVSPVAHGVWEETMCLRSHDAEQLTGLPDWVELALPMSARGDVLGLLLLARPGNGYFNSRQIRVLRDVADTMAFGLLVINLVETMQQLLRQSLYEKEQQRHQIATEIHNEPLQTLTALAMQLQISKAVTTTTLQEAAVTIREVANELRRIISGLRPPVLRESVEWIVRQSVREFDQTHRNLAINLQIDAPGQRQAAETTKIAVYYILTEALNNIKKHAQAQTVTVDLYYGDEELKLVITDDGVGPGIARQPLTQLLRNQHIGVADMHRWASVASGELTINVCQPTGTSVTLLLPLETASVHLPEKLVTFEDKKEI